MPSFSAVVFALMAVCALQHLLGRISARAGARGSVHSMKRTPINSCPSALSMWAVVLESMPPDNATKIFIEFESVNYGERETLSLSKGGEAVRIFMDDYYGGNWFSREEFGLRV